MIKKILTSLTGRIHLTNPGKEARLANVADAINNDEATNLGQVNNLIPEFGTSSGTVLEGSNHALYSKITNEKNIVKTSTQNTTVITATNITDLSFTVAANEIWIIDIVLLTYCNTVNGTHFQLSAPTGTTSRVALTANFSGFTSWYGSNLDIISTETTNLNRYAGVGQVRFSGTITCGSTGGTIQMTYRSNVATDQSTVYDKSYIIAKKV